MAEPVKAYTRKLKPRLSNKERFHCVTAEINIEQYPTLKEWLPMQHDYHVCDYNAIRQNQDHIDFSTTLRMGLSTVEEIQQFVKDLPITWRIDRTRPPKGQRVLFKVDYRCHHNTKPRKSMEGSGRRTKNTNCPAKMAVTLQRPQGSNGRQCRSTDPHMPVLPTIVHIVNEHNHNLHVGDALRYKDVGEEAIQKLKKLFEAGHSPSTALDVLKYDLQLEHGDGYPNAAADRSICPDLQFCYRLYHQVSKQDFPACDGAGVAEALERQIDMYNNQCTEQCTKLTTVTDSLPSTISALPPNPDPMESSPPEVDESTQTCVMEQEVTKAAEGAEAENPVDKLKSCLAGLCALIEKDSSLWPATHDLIKGIEKVQHNPGKLASAMHAFGCYSCLTLMTKRAKPLRRRAQSSSVGRQKAKLERRSLTIGKGAVPDHENIQPGLGQ